MLTATGWTPPYLSPQQSYLPTSTQVSDHWLKHSVCSSYETHLNEFTFSQPPLSSSVCHREFIGALFQHPKDNRESRVVVLPVYLHLNYQFPPLCSLVLHGARPGIFICFPGLCSWNEKKNMFYLQMPKLLGYSHNELEMGCNTKPSWVPTDSPFFNKGFICGRWHRQNDASQKMTTSQLMEPVTILQYVAKGTSQMALSEGPCDEVIQNYWVGQSHHKSPTERERESESESVRDLKMLCYWFWRQKKTSWVKESSSLLDTWSGKKTDLTLETPDKM